MKFCRETNVCMYIEWMADFDDDGYDDDGYDDDDNDDDDDDG